MDLYGQEWQDPAHVAVYREETLADFPHLAEGDAVFAELLPAQVRRVLDVGCGDGRLTALVRAACTPHVDAALLQGRKPT